MKIFNSLVNLIVGLLGLGVILHLVHKNEELDRKRASAEASEKFWEDAYKSESKLRIGYMFDVMDWRRLYKKYGWGGNPVIWDKYNTERLMSGEDDEAEDLTKS